MTFEAFGGFCAVVIFAANNERVSLELIIWEDLINPKLEFSNHSAGIFSFAKAKGSGKRSSMHGSRPKAGLHTFSRSGKRGTAHHRGLVSLRISDGKFVNHTTEMILWSMILTLHHQSCLYDKPGISQQIGEEKLGTIQQNGLSW